MEPVSPQPESPVTLASSWRNAGWLLAERALRMIVSFAVGIAVSRYLGPSSFGLLNSGLATAALCVAVVDLGFDTVLRRELISRHKDRNKLLGAVAAARAALLIPASALLVWLVIAQSPDAGALIPPLLLTLFSPLFSTIDSWFQSQTQARYTVWSQTCALIVGAAARVALIVAGAGVIAFGWVLAAESLIVGLLLVFFYQSSGQRISNWRPSFTEIRLLWRDTWPFAVINLSALFYTRLDIVLLNAIRGTEEAGHYVAAMRFVEVGYVLPMILINSFFPQLARLHSESRIAYEKRLQWLISVVTLVTGLAAAGLSFFGPLIVRLTIGNEYAPSAGVLQIAAWGVVFACQGAARSQWILLANLQRYALGYVSVGAALNITLNLWLIPTHGALGAAFSSVVTQATVVFIVPWLFAPTRPSLRFLLNGFLLRELLPRFSNTSKPN